MMDLSIDPSIFNESLVRRGVAARRLIADSARPLQVGVQGALGSSTVLKSSSSMCVKYSRGTESRNRSRAWKLESLTTYSRAN